MSTSPLEKISVLRPISIVTHDAIGRPINNSRNFGKDNSDPFQLDAKSKDYYYSKEINKRLGIADLVAYLETLTGALLWWYAPSPATAINEFTTLSEVGQVEAARSERLSEERSDGAMAWLQVIAGLGGLASCLADVVFHREKENKELSVNQKISLSITSIFNSVVMFFGAGEKTLMATTTNGNGTRSKSMRMNGNSDARCSIEWFAMSLVPWFSRFEPFKKALDYAITYFALREGIEHFVKEGVSMVFNDKVKKLPGLLEKVFKVVFLIRQNDSKTIIWPFNKKWFLGTETDKNKKGEVEAGAHGVRAKLIKVLKGFGCNPPTCYFDKDRNIVTEFYEEVKVGQTAAIS